MSQPFFKPRCIVAGVFFSLILVGCGKGQAPQEPVRAVKVLQVGASDASTDLEFSGEVRARIESALGFRVSGKVLNRPAEIGQRVKAGELLAQLDPQDYRATADAAAAQLVAAQTKPSRRSRTSIACGRSTTFSAMMRCLRGSRKPAVARSCAS